MRERNRVAAGVFGIIFGAFGAHHFYLGNKKRGLLCLLLTLFVPLCSAIFTIIGMVEGFKLLMMSDDEFEISFCGKSADAEKNMVLIKFNDLLDNGTLTKEEFEFAEQKIMNCEGTKNE